MLLYTRNRCSACDNVKRYLNANEYKYREVNIEEDYDAAMHLINTGLRSVPILSIGDELIVGAENIKVRV